MGRTKREASFPGNALRGAHNCSYVSGIHSYLYVPPAQAARVEEAIEQDITRHFFCVYHAHTPDFGPFRDQTFWVLFSTYVPQQRCSLPSPPKESISHP